VAAKIQKDALPRRQRWLAPSPWVLRYILTLALPACGGRVGDEVPAPRTGCVPTLGEKLVRHACVHISNGPYTSVAGSTTPSELPDVSKLHRAFDVTAAEQPFSLRYRAARSGHHVLLTDAKVTWSVQNSEGQTVDTQHEVLGPNSSADWTPCAGSTHAALVEFELGQQYTLLGNSAPERFTFFVEHVETFGAQGLSVSCW
jgi:hypothetical protein